MKSEKDDRRVKYTKMVLKESFIKLLSEKDLSKITIKEICEDADINRATFYAHYTDQYDLLHKIQGELFENVNSYLSAFPQNDTSSNLFDTLVDMLERILEYIKENSKLCKLLLSERGDLNLQKQIIMLVYDKSVNVFKSRGALSNEHTDYIYAYIVTGCVGVIQKWLDDDMQLPTRQMAALIVKLTQIV